MDQECIVYYLKSTLAGAVQVAQGSSWQLVQARGWRRAGGPREARAGRPGADLVFQGCGGGECGPCQLPQKCLIFESAAFLFPPRERAGERVTEQRSEPASLPAGGRGPGSQTPRKGRGTDTLFGVTAQFLLRNDFYGCIFPPLPKSLAFFQCTTFSWKSPAKKKACCPVFLGVFQPWMQRVHFAQSSFKAAGDFSCTTRQGMRWLEPWGCINCLQAEGARTFLNPLASHRSNSPSLGLDRAGQWTGGEKPEKAASVPAQLSRK